MAQFTTYSLESNKRIKFDFGGGELSSDSGLLLLKEFVAKIGLLSYIEKIFRTSDPAKRRLHKDADNLMQIIYQIICGYFEDDCADELKNEPINWCTCSLREWLTSSFFNIAFNKNERAAIVQTDVSYDAWRNQDQVIKDYVFILSMDEVLEYMRSEEDRLCTKTWYAVVEAGMEKYENSGDPAHWWLRDRYNDLRQAYFIKNDGELSYGDDGRMYYDFYAYVRPAVWVDLEADFFN